MKIVTANWLDTTSDFVPAVNGVNISAPDAIQLPGSAVVHGLPTVLVPPGGLAAVVALCSSPANLTGGHPLPTNATPAAGTSSAVGATAAVPGGESRPNKNQQRDGPRSHVVRWPQMLCYRFLVGPTPEPTFGSAFLPI